MCSVQNIKNGLSIKVRSDNERSVSVCIIIYESTKDRRDYDGHQLGQKAQTTQQKAALVLAQPTDSDWSETH